MTVRQQPEVSHFGFVQFVTRVRQKGCCVIQKRINMVKKQVETGLCVCMCVFIVVSHLIKRKIPTL